MCKCCDKDQPSSSSHHHHHHHNHHGSGSGAKNDLPKPVTQVKKEDLQEKNVNDKSIKWRQPESPPEIPTTSAYGGSQFEVKHPEINSDSEESSNRAATTKNFPDTRDFSVDEEIDVQPMI